MCWTPVCREKPGIKKINVHYINKQKRKENPKQTNTRSNPPTDMHEVYTYQYYDKWCVAWVSNFSHYTYKEFYLLRVTLSEIIFGCVYQRETGIFGVVLFFANVVRAIH